MMLRWAARISCGSAFAIAFSAASRSPFLIASSTVRTAPRICVRRDLLTMVRRAILRVAFLAEVVLAMLSNILRRRSLAAICGYAPLAAASGPIDAMGCPDASLRMLVTAANARSAPLKEQRRRDCARRHFRPL